MDRYLSLLLSSVSCQNLVWNFFFFFAFHAFTAFDGKKRVWWLDGNSLRQEENFGWLDGNGVQVFIQEEGKYFVAEDFVLLETVEYDKRVKPVEELVEKIEWESVEPDDLTRCLLI
jgi:hypothetical protein